MMCNDLERSRAISSSNLDDQQQQRDDRNEDRDLTHCCVCGGVLRHPSVLWGCLHSCCRQCSESKFAAAAAAAGPVVCPVCDTVVEATDVVDNPLVAARAEGHQRAGRAAATTMCDSCRDDEVDSLAHHWCTVCCRSLCNGCRSWHDRFFKDHAMVAVGSDADRTLSSSQQQQQSSSSASAALPGPAAGLCAVHRIPLEFFCFVCARAKCLACVKECMEARHDSSGLTSERVGKHVTSLGESLRAELALIDERLDAVTGLRERAVAARAVEVAEDERLDASHRLALDAVTGAYDAALEDLNKAYDSLSEDSAAPYLASRAQLLAARLTHAFKYCSALLEAASSTAGGGGLCMGAIDCVLDQRQVVLACLDSLSNEASQLPKVADESELTLVECKQDDGRLRRVAFRFMGGISGVATDDFAKEGVEQTGRSGDGDRRSATSFLGGSTGAGDSVAVEPPSMGSRSLSTSAGASSSSWLATGTDARPDEGPRNMPSATDARKSTVTASSAGPLAVLDVKEIVDSFRAVSTCHDVAITADGHVLLAALENGLKQYEASSGRKRRTWYPSRSGRMRVVSTVDSLADGRAAVGLIGASCVVVLSREPPDGWQEERSINIEPAPYRIAVLGDRFAVACATARETGKSFGWTPGPHFSTGTLAPTPPTTSKPSVSRKLGYDILGIALVAASVAAGDSTAAVVVSSHDKILTQSGMHRFVVEAYGDGDEGACLWQYTSSEDIFDLCTLCEPSRVVYLALPKSRRVVALSGDDGSSLADVLTTSTHTLIPPNRLAASLEHRMLAVLSGNGLVTLYPIA